MYSPSLTPSPGTPLEKLDTQQGHRRILWPVDARQLLRSISHSRDSLRAGRLHITSSTMDETLGYWALIERARHLHSVVYMPSSAAANDTNNSYGSFFWPLVSSMIP
jgi:hypothetical protein